LEQKDFQTNLGMFVNLTIHLLTFRTLSHKVLRTLVTLYITYGERLSPRALQVAITVVVTDLLFVTRYGSSPTFHRSFGDYDPIYLIPVSSTLNMAPGLFSKSCSSRVAFSLSKYIPLLTLYCVAIVRVSWA